MTTHIEAEKGEIANTVIMPGDPKRAKYYTKKYLKKAKLVNTVRGILAYTGYYKNKKVTIMASGMGMPSIAIYATELFNYYGVENIIRVGTCGSLKEDLPLNEIILVEKAYTNSNFAKELTGKIQKIESSSFTLNERIMSIANKYNIDIKFGTINTSDIFYTEYESKLDEDCIAVEMETFALLFIAKHLKKEATAILTVSDNVVRKDKISCKEREKCTSKAFVLALESL